MISQIYTMDEAAARMRIGRRNLQELVKAHPFYFSNGAREMNPQWARDLRDASKRFGRRFFMKQMTGKRPIPDDLMVREFPSPSQEVRHDP